MELILVGRSDAGLPRLRSAFASGTAAITDGLGLLRAGDPDPPEPLGPSHGSLLICVDSEAGAQARGVLARLMHGREDRVALLIEADLEQDKDAWIEWLAQHSRASALVAADSPDRDPAGFVEWFEDVFGERPPAFSASTPPEMSGPCAKLYAPPTPFQAAELERPIRRLDRLKAVVRHWLWRRRHSDADLNAVRSSPHFDADWYLSANADVAAAGLDPALHFLAAGAAEGRPPGPGFSTVAWYEKHPDARREGINPLLYILKGDQ